MRAAMCVVVRDLIVYGVLSDMMKGAARDLRDVLELRRGGAPLRARAGGHAGGPAEARPAVPPHREGARVRAAAVRDRRPLRPRSDPGRDLPAAERLRARRPRRPVALHREGGARLRRRERQDGRPRREGRARAHADGGPEGVDDKNVRARLGQPRPDLPAREPRRLTLEEIEGASAADYRPAGAPARRLPARALGEDGRSSSAQTRRTTSTTAAIDGEDPLAPFSPNAADHLLRTDGFPHVADVVVNSFYDPGSTRGCAFEELISFHGGLGGRRRDRSSCTRSRCRSRAADRRRRRGPRLSAGAARSDAASRAPARGTAEVARRPHRSSTGIESRVAGARPPQRLPTLRPGGRAPRPKYPVDAVVLTGSRAAPAPPRPSRCATRGRPRRRARRRADGARPAENAARTLPLLRRAADRARRSRLHAPAPLSTRFLFSRPLRRARDRDVESACRRRPTLRAGRRGSSWRSRSVRRHLRGRRGRAESRGASSDRHHRLHPGLERGGEPARRARRPEGRAAGRRRARRRRRLHRPDCRRRARAGRRSPLAGDEPRAAGRHRAGYRCALEHGYAFCGRVDADGQHPRRS